MPKIKHELRVRFKENPTKYRVTLTFLSAVDSRYHDLTAFIVGAEHAVTFAAVQCWASGMVRRVQIVRLEKGRDEEYLLYDGVFDARVLAKDPEFVRGITSI